MSIDNEIPECVLCQGFAVFGKPCPAHQVEALVSVRRDDMAYSVARYYGLRLGKVRHLIMCRDLDAAVVDMQRAVKGMELTLAGIRARRGTGEKQLEARTISGEFTIDPTTARINGESVEVAA